MAEGGHHVIGLLAATLLAAAFLLWRRWQQRGVPQALPTAQQQQQQQQQAAVDKQPSAGVVVAARSVSVAHPQAPTAVVSPFAAAAARRASSPTLFGPADAPPLGGPAAALSAAGSSEAESFGSTLERRNSPPHLSTLPAALPFLQTLPPPPAAAQPPLLQESLSAPVGINERSADSSGGPPSPGVRSSSPGRKLVQQLQQELAAEGHPGCPTLDRLLSQRSAAAAARAGGSAGTRAGPGGSPDGRADGGGGDFSSPPLPPARSLSGPAFQLSDWEVSPNELEICRRPDGSLWQLGAGGFGRVYKALRFGCTPVAVKVLAPHGGGAAAAQLADFEREVQLLRACKDPHIVSFLGASLSDDFTMLVTEYCEGGALSANLAAGRISWYRRGKEVALDVARGLTFLHARGVCHLDLKSANILLDRHGRAKIADLGLARILLQDRSTVTANLGTLHWAAPELLLGQRCSEKADIYSLGIVLWEIATGLLPARGRMRPLVCPADCPPEVAALVEACMQPDPTQRPSAAQLVEALAAVPGSPPQASPAPAQQPQRSRSRLGRSASSVSVSALAGRPPRPRSEASLPSGAAQGSPQPALEQAVVASAAAAAAAAAPPPPAAAAAAPLPSPRQQATGGSPAPQAPHAATLPLLSERASSDSAAVRVAPLAAAVAAHPVDRGLSLPVPQQASSDSLFMDQFGLGLF